MKTVSSVQELAEYIWEVSAEILDFAGDLTPWVTEQFGDLEKLHEGYFDAEADPLGIAWVPLAPYTIAKKGHDEILIETGRLKASLVTSTADSIRYHVGGQPRETDMVFGTMVEYAGIHQAGTDRIPQRQMLGINEAVAHAMAVRLADYITKGMQDGL